MVGGKDFSSLTNFTGSNVFGIGNALITNYSISAGLGNMPTTQLSFEANNIVFDTFTGNNSVPALTYSGKKTFHPYNFTTGVFIFLYIIYMYYFQAIKNLVEFKDYILNNLGIPPKIFFANDLGFFINKIIIFII